MAIVVADIEQGWVYRTHKQQERLVLGWDRDGLVVYTSRGRDKEHPFRNCHVRLSAKRFVDSVEAKIREMPDLEEYIVANKATTVVVRSQGARRAGTTGPSRSVGGQPDAATPDV